MAKLTRVHSLGLVNIHKFRHKTTGAVVRVECSDKEYTDLGKKGAGEPPNRSWPSPAKDYIWIGSSGGADKFAEGRYSPNPGEFFVRDGRVYIRPHDATQPMIVTDPSKNVVTGDLESRIPTITITPDPSGWRVINGDLIKK